MKGFELKNLSKFAAFDMRWVCPYEESNDRSSDLSKDCAFDDRDKLVAFNYVNKSIILWVLKDDEDKKVE